MLDDLDTPQPIAKRPRKPWWRWNLISLAIALFGLVWLREIFRFDYMPTFFWAAFIGLAWAIGPKIVEGHRIENEATAVNSPPDNRSTSTRSSRPRQPTIPLHLVWARIYALIHIAISILGNLLMLWRAIGEVSNIGFRGVAFPGGRGFFEVLFTLVAFSGPMASLCLGIALLVLTEMAIYQRRRDAMNSTSSTESRE